MGRRRVLYLRCLGFLSSPKLAFLLLVALTLGAIVGTLFPQQPTTRNEVVLVFWRKAVMARYGGFTRLFAALGLFDIFHSAWFLGLVAALLLNMSVCTATRLRSIWRSLTRTSVEVTDALLASCESRANFVAREPGATAEVIVENLRRAGFRVLRQERDNRTHIYAEQHGWARLGTTLVHGAVILIVLAATWGRVVGWRVEALALSPGTEPNVEQRDFQLRGEGFEVVPYPDGSARDFRAQVAVLEAGQVVHTGIIRINEPLSHRGVGIYLVSFDQDEAGHLYPIVMAVYDPGYPLVIFGGLCFMIGIMLRFYFPLRRAWCRVNRDGMVEIGADTKEWFDKWVGGLQATVGG